MNTWIRRTLQVGLISTGFVLVGAAASHADTTVNDGFLNGNAVVVPIQLPINVCGNALAVFDDASASCEGGAVAGNNHGANYRRGGTTINKGALNGNTIAVPIQAPINVSGNAVGLFDDARAASRGGAAAHLDSARGSRSGGDTTINKGVLNGNLIAVPIQVPVNVCGNAIAGFDDAEASCRGGAVAHNGHGNRGRGHGRDRHASQLGHDNRDHRDGRDVTVNKGFGNGNKVLVPIQLPVNICGNALAFRGDAAAACEGGAAAGLGGRKHSGSKARHAGVSRNLNNAGYQGAGVRGHGHHGWSHGWNGHNSGWNHGWNGHRGNGWLNDACCDGRDGRDGRGRRGDDVTINKGVLNGNLVAVPIQVPINVCGNAVGVFGDAEAACEGGAVARRSFRTHNRGGHGDVTINKGFGNGNKVLVPVQIPVNISGNALALFGDASAASRGGAFAWL
jgi:hypothetical protein